MIERLYVHNYRCFENFTLDLKGKPSALVIGKNGSGKSTLRRVLEVLRWACVGGSLIRHTLTRLDFCRDQTRVPMRFEVGVTLGKRRFDYALSFEWDENQKAVRIAGERLIIDGTSVLLRDKDSLTLSDTASFKIDLPGTMLTLVGGEQSDGAVQLFKDFFSSALLLAPAPVAMSSDFMGEPRTLQSDAKNFCGWLNTHLTRQPARYAEVIRFLQPLMPDLASFDFVPNGVRGKRLRVQFERADMTEDNSLALNFGRLSDGEKCFFLSAAITTFNRKDSPLFCFWDEPDNHLALHEVSHFITYLRRMTNNGGQFIATSHHPETIRRFSDENTVVFTRNSHLEPTRVRTLSEIEYHGDLINAILRGEVIE